MKYYRLKIELQCIYRLLSNFNGWLLKTKITCSLIYLSFFFIKQNDKIEINKNANIYVINKQ